MCICKLDYNMINFILLILLPIQQLLCQSIDMNVNDNVPQAMVKLLAHTMPNSQKSSFILQPKNINERISENLQQQHHDNRFRRSTKDLLRDSPLNWNYLRRYICGTGNQKCLYDERLV